MVENIINMSFKHNMEVLDLKIKKEIRFLNEFNFNSICRKITHQFQENFEQSLNDGRSCIDEQLRRSLFKNFLFFCFNWLFEIQLTT